MVLISVSSAEEALFSWKLHPLRGLHPLHPFVKRVGVKGCACIKSSMQRKGTVGNEEESDLIKENYSLWRLMIDKKYQGQGFGRQTIDSAMDLIRTFPFGKAQKVWLSYEPENTHAKDIYESMDLWGTGKCAVMKSLPYMNSKRKDVRSESSLFPDCSPA